MTVPLLDRLQALADARTGGAWLTPHERGEILTALPLLIQACRALDEVHEYQCGCDRPGNAAACVAKPAAITFAALAPLAGSGE